MWRQMLEVSVGRQNRCIHDVGGRCDPRDRSFHGATNPETVRINHRVGGIDSA